MKNRGAVAGRILETCVALGDIVTIGWHGLSRREWWGMPQQEQRRCEVESRRNGERALDAPEGQRGSG